MSACQVRPTVHLIHFHTLTQTRVPSITGGNGAATGGKLWVYLIPPSFCHSTMLAAARLRGRHLSECDGGLE